MMKKAREEPRIALCLFTQLVTCGTVKIDVATTIFHTSVRLHLVELYLLWHEKYERTETSLPNSNIPQRMTSKSKGLKGYIEYIQTFRIRNCVLCSLCINSKKNKLVLKIVRQFGKVSIVVLMRSH